MRDKNQNIQKYISSLEKELKKVPKRILDLRNRVIVNPNFQFDHLSGLPRKRDEIFSCLLFCKWFPDEIRSFCQVELENSIKNFSFEDQKELLLLASLTKEQTLYFLTEHPNFSDRDFFGNLLPKGRRCLEKFSFSIFKERKGKYVQRKRGYNDHGSRRPDSKWLPSYDFSFLEEQNYLEYKRELLEFLIIEEKKYLTKDINICKNTENFDREFPSQCRSLGNPFFCCLFFENWDNEDLIVHDYLLFLMKN